MLDCQKLVETSSSQLGCGIRRVLCEERECWGQESEPARVCDNRAAGLLVGEKLASENVIAFDVDLGDLELEVKWKYSKEGEDAPQTSSTIHQDHWSR